MHQDPAKFSNNYSKNKWMLRVLFSSTAIITAAVYLFPRVIFYNHTLSFVVFGVSLPVIFIIIHKILHDYSWLPCFVVASILAATISVFANYLNQLSLHNVTTVKGNVIAIAYVSPKGGYYDVNDYTVFELATESVNRSLKIRLLGIDTNIKQNDSLTLCDGTGLLGAATYALVCK